MKRKLFKISLLPLGLILLLSASCGHRYSSPEIRQSFDAFIKCTTTCHPVNPGGHHDPSDAYLQCFIHANSTALMIKRRNECNGNAQCLADVDHTIEQLCTAQTDHSYQEQEDCVTKCRNTFSQQYHE